MNFQTKTITQQIQATSKITKHQMHDPQTSKIQEGIRRLMKQKKLAKENKQLSEIRRRVASQNVLDECSLPLKGNNQEEATIRTEWRKRITSDEDKYRDTENSQTTTETLGRNNKVQVQKIVNNVFAHSPKLTQYLEQYSIKKQDALQQLMTNELFVLSLSSKLSKMGQSDPSTLNSIVQNQIILKLTKISRKKKHSLSLFDVENRLKSLINKRLDILQKY